jgi:hypothetical protein
MSARRDPEVPEEIAALAGVVPKGPFFYRLTAATNLASIGCVCASALLGDLAEPLPTERAFPADQLGAAEKAKLLEHVRTWILPVLTSGRRDHPFFELWHRKDWLATTELLSLAMNLRRLDARLKGSDFLRNCRKQSVSDNADNRTGHLWEVWCAGVLEHPSQAVIPAPNNTPGFDLTFESAGVGVRASCKALNPSKQELEFRTFCEVLNACLAQRLKAGRFVQIVMVSEAPERGVQRDAIALGDQIAELANQTLGSLSLGEWKIYITPYHHRQPFWNGEASYSLFVASAHGDEEQRRFTTKLEDALENLDRHCSNPAPNTTNVVLMRVPPPISMADAKALSASQLTRDISHVSTVILMRTQLFLRTDGGVAELGHEYERVENPAAAVPTPDFKIELPIGHPIGEPGLFAAIAGQKISADRSFKFLQGRRCHVGRSGRSDGHFPIHGFFTETVSCVAWISGNMVRADLAGFPNWTLIL